MRLAAFAGKFALFLAGLAWLTFISLFVVGAYLASWPIMRVSPGNRKVTSLMGLAVSGMAAARAYGLTDSPGIFSERPATEATEVTEESWAPPPVEPQTLADFLNWARRERGSYLTDTGVLALPDIHDLLADFANHRETLEGGE